MVEPTIEEAWALSGVDYLIENDYPDLVDGIRNLALAVLDDILPRCQSSACASCRYGSKDWYCRRCTYRRRIEALGKPVTTCSSSCGTVEPAPDVHCPRCGRASMTLSPELGVRFGARFCRYMVACGYQEIP